MLNVLCTLQAAQERVYRAKSAWTTAAIATLMKAPGAADLVEPALAELTAARAELDRLNREAQGEEAQA